LEQKRQLDAGIQQILQTHVAVANGDLKVRAPLTQDHVLWQVAAALNNLIARLQSLSDTERELRRQIRKESERASDHHPKADTTMQRALKPDTTAQQAQKTDTTKQRALKPGEREKLPSPVRTKGKPS